VIAEAATLRHEIWHSRDFTEKLVSIRSSKDGFAPYPDGAAGAWPEMVNALFVTGPVACLNVNCSVAEHVEWLQREDPVYLHTFPSVAERAAVHCLENDIRLPRLRDIETIAERITPRTRELCREAFDVPVIGIYSSREIGHISHQCPDHEHDHIQSEVTLVEILNEDGDPCEPGEIGRVVVTPLHNFAMPFIRYDIGDYAEVGEACPCGRGLPVISKILGREQEKVYLPTGEQRWSLLSANVLKELLACGPIREYQLIQKTIDAMEMRLVVKRDLANDEMANVSAWVERTFGYPFQVTVTRVPEIPRTAGGKVRNFISELPAKT
jgi:phenylacetate-CoA ligase